jgi:hypothetical protein
MKKVRLNTRQLLGIVKDNRNKHMAAYDEAVIDHKASVIKTTEENLKIANQNYQIAESYDLTKMQAFKAILPAPKHYEKEYNRAIRMLELEVEKEIELEEAIFNQLVMDEWQWKDSFIGTNSLYKSK